VVCLTWFSSGSQRWHDDTLTFAILTRVGRPVPGQAMLQDLSPVTKKITIAIQKARGGLVRTLPNSEPKLRVMFDKLAAHGPVLVVVDQPATMGMTPLRSWACWSATTVTGRAPICLHRQRGHVPPQRRGRD
jgi:hypothetical protein